MSGENKSAGPGSPNIGVVWAQYGPYHFARVAALKKLAGSGVHAMEIGSRTTDYAWQRSANELLELITLCPDAVTEELSFLRVFRQTRRKLSDLGIEACLLPSYSPRQSLAAFLAARSLGVRTVMMSESHAGTARSGAVGSFIKGRLVRMFDSALVGGGPQKRYVVSLGLPERKVFTGYDAVDNDYFAGRAEEIRRRRADFQQRYRLPARYFLSLGRFVPKKNLSTLLRAFRRYLDSAPGQGVHLVMVGSGGEEPALRSLCAELKLPVYEKSAVGTPTLEKWATAPAPETAAGVHFYGFRQIEENPVFYALAEAFILPSLYEEWGLVVNEAMASGLPVIVSETAGCAEDLLEECGTRSGWPEHGNLRTSDTNAKCRANGMVFDPGSVAELSGALAQLAAGPALREAMGRASRCIVEKFSCAAFARNALLAVQAASGDTQP